MPKVYTKIPCHRVFMLIQPGNLETKQHYSIKCWLKFSSKKYHLFSFYDRNNYKPLANDNPKQYLES